MGDIRSDDDSCSYAWRDLLQRWSDEWLDPVLHEQERAEPFPDEVRRARWLGTRGAAASAVDALGARLGRELPPSYRQFLLTSDGWLDTTHCVDRLLPVAEVGWTRDLDPQLIAAWTDGYGESDGSDVQIDDADYFVYDETQSQTSLRPEYLAHTLKISETPDATDVYLLNPCVVTADGEWEAWYLAHWMAGAVRYRSFWELMNDEYLRFRGDK